MILNLYIIDELYLQEIFILISLAIQTEPRS